MHIRVLTLMALLLAVPLAAQQTASPTSRPGPRADIVASAQGETKVTPDRATIDIGVQTRATTATAASAENARKQRAVIDAIRALGVADAQISTANYNVSPEQVYEPNKEPRITGYTVSNSVRVDVHKIDQLGAIIDAALAKGANNINSLNFYSSNESDARRTALAAAIASARGDAQAMAQAAGGTLGDLIEASSSPTYTPQPPIPFRAMAMGKAESTPISPGEQTLTVMVTTRWHFISGIK
ncbi:MAG: SIMPL domain-containing protein [Gemmatimonadaceae bacterium]